MNDVRLAVALIAKAVLRYSPAGVAILDAELQFDGAVDEAGIPRKLSFRLPAVAMGHTAVELDRLALGSRLDAHGFIATRSKRSTKLVLHLAGWTVRAADTAPTPDAVE